MSSDTCPKTRLLTILTLNHRTVSDTDTTLPILEQKLNHKIIPQHENTNAPGAHPKTPDYARHSPDYVRTSRRSRCQNWAILPRVFAVPIRPDGLLQTGRQRVDHGLHPDVPGADLRGGEALQALPQRVEPREGAQQRPRVCGRRLREHGHRDPVARVRGRRGSVAVRARRGARHPVSGLLDRVWAEGVRLAPWRPGLPGRRVARWFQLGRLEVFPSVYRLSGVPAVMGVSMPPVER